jgi:hypothetical protein
VLSGPFSLLTRFQLADDFRDLLVEVNVVVDHLPRAVFATINVRNSKLGVDFIACERCIYMLGAQLVGKIATDTKALITQLDLRVRRDLGDILPRVANLVLAELASPERVHSGDVRVM